MMYILDFTCGELNVVWTLFGYIIWGIKVVVPLLLIISGMITMAKAVMEKDEKKIKDAQNLLVKKVIAAVIVYLVITITKVVIGLVATDDWKACVECAFSPFGANCGFDKVDIPSNM